jgi:hypothetical protein
MGSTLAKGFGHGADQDAGVGRDRRYDPQLEQRTRCISFERPIGSTIRGELVH